MAETANYGLYVTDNGAEDFIDWRKKLNGLTNSNMTKIDEILADKAENSYCITGVLLADGWTGTAGSYVQTLAMNGVTADTNGVLSMSPDTTQEQREAVRQALLSVVSQNDDQITVRSEAETAPSCDIPVSLMIVG